MMHIEYDGKTFDFDLEDVTTEQLVKIQKTYGLDFLGLAQGMQRGNIDALRCIYWLMQVHAGTDLLRLETVTLDRPAKFVVAILTALTKEAQELSDAAEKEAKDKKAPKE